MTPVISGHTDRASSALRPPTLTTARPPPLTHAANAAVDGAPASAYGRAKISAEKMSSPTILSGSFAGSIGVTTRRSASRPANSAGYGETAMAPTVPNISQCSAAAGESVHSPLATTLSSWSMRAARTRSSPLLRKTYKKQVFRDIFGESNVRDAAAVALPIPTLASTCTRPFRSRRLLRIVTLTGAQLALRYTRLSPTSTSMDKSAASDPLSIVVASKVRNRFTARIDLQMARGRNGLQPWSAFMPTPAMRCHNHTRRL